nr:MAG TPA: hypothetical protein [Caudoviricetes sp.]
MLMLMLSITVVYMLSCLLVYGLMWLVGECLDD